MRVRVYREGYEPEDGQVYDLAPRFAVELYAEEHVEKSATGFSFNLCVEPVDDEARAMTGWHTDEESEAFRMFEVQVAMKWHAKEVDTFFSHTEES